MKTRQLFTGALLIGLALPAIGQFQAPEILIKKVLENNKTLRVARESFQVTTLEAGTGNTPPDPEVEFGYLFGNPSEIGNRVDFRVSQQVDFPTAYIHKTHLRQIRTNQAELEYVIARQKVLLLTQELWIERLHLNQQEQLLLERLRQAEVINDHFKQKLASGEVGHLAYNQSTLQLAALQSETEQVLAKIRSNQFSLNEISGGEEVEIIDRQYPPLVSIVPDSLLKAYNQSPELLLYIHEQQLKEEQKSLAVSQNLPKLSAGYYSETILDQRFKGVHVGVTIPLWQNANRIKMARAEVIFAEADADRYTVLQRKGVLQKLDQLESIKIRANQLEEALGSGNSTALLTLALNSGEISLSEYFYASDFYFRNEQKLLQYKRDQLLLEADLLKVYL